VGREEPSLDRSYELNDRYRRESGRVWLRGVEALVRLPLEQRRRDRAAGLDTAGFISGYRGSPLGTYDLALWNARELLESHRVRFEPGVNEDLAATAVWGSQQANLHPGARHDGVFGIRGAARRCVRHLVRQGPGRGPLVRRAQARELRGHCRERRRARAHGGRSGRALLVDRAPERARPDSLRHTPAAGSASSA
jgi:hypothetical protein